MGLFDTGSVDDVPVKGTDGGNADADKGDGKLDSRPDNKRNCVLYRKR